jgi:hypothetical protein
MPLQRIHSFGGEDSINIITYGLDSSRRINALKVYTLFVVFQSIGLWISHHIVKYKNEIREKSVQLRIKTQVKLRRGMKYAFFVSHRAYIFLIP